MTRPKPIPRSKDFDIRAGLVRALLAAGVKRECIRHELTLDSSSSDGRADIVIIGAEALIGVEIKSGSDNFDLLPQQTERYRCRFDRMVIALDSRHSEAWGAHNWEITTHWSRCCVGWDGSATEVNTSIHECGWAAMTQTRTRSHSHLRLSAAAMLSLLWANEACAVAADLGVNCSTRSKAIPYAAENFSIHEIRKAVAAQLLARRLNRWEESFWCRFDAMAMEVAA